MRVSAWSMFAGPLILGWSCVHAAQADSTPGTPAEPVRYIGGKLVDATAHDGKLRPVVGVENIQVHRAVRSDRNRLGVQGWTFHHQPMLAYWRGRFYLQFWGNAIGEHVPPNGTIVVSSPDGRTWSKPEIVFPQVTLPDGNITLTHQRMGFYVAPNGRLLVSAFHGRSPEPFGKDGVGRVVREVLASGGYGPIYFIRYNRHAGWNETNGPYPYFKAATDPRFVEACEALLSNRLHTLQWWQEDQSPDDFYSLKGNLQALSFFHRKDGTVVGLWKYGLSALSSDEGSTWSKPIQSPTIRTGAAKIWGQRTADGRYALVYNPINDAYHRYPLAIITGSDGIAFDGLAAIHGEVPPRRYFGNHKDLGPQYVRGIAEGNGTPPGNDLWVTYSVNKEDIWISRVPLPVRDRVAGPVADNFDTIAPGASVPGWNLYSPLWAPVRVAAFPSASNRSLELSDSDPYDFAKAMRVFEDVPEISVGFKILAKPALGGSLEVALETAEGSAPVRIRFESGGALEALDGAAWLEVGRHEPAGWLDVRLEISKTSRRFKLVLNGRRSNGEFAFSDVAPTLERIVFRTGPKRVPRGRNVSPLFGRDLPGADDPDPVSTYYIDDVEIRRLPHGR